jgi:hypothetical protein
MVPQHNPRASRDASVTLLFGDGDHVFRLGLGELRKLEEARGAGAIEVMARIAAERWRVDDVIDTLRFGLIGGGKTDVDAAKLLRLYVEPTPLMHHAATALAVLTGALYGFPSDPIAEPADTKVEAPGPAAGGADTFHSPPSTAPGP